MRQSQRELKKIFNYFTPAHHVYGEVERSRFHLKIRNQCMWIKSICPLMETAIMSSNAITLNNNNSSFAIVANNRCESSRKEKISRVDLLSFVGNFLFPKLN